MRLAIHAPLICIALGAIMPRAEALEIYNEEDTATVLNADLSAAYGYFTIQKNYLMNPDRYPGRMTWTEGYVKAGLSGRTDMAGVGSLYGGLNFVSNATWGDGDAGGTTNGTERETSVEDAYIGWKSGDLFPALGQDGVDFSFGKQVIAVDPFLLNDDGFNPGVIFDPRGEGDGRFDRGGTYVIASRLALKNSAVLKIGGTEGLHGSLLWLKSHAPSAGTELAAATMDYTMPIGSLGLTYIHGLSVDDRYAYGPFAERAGMNVYSIRGRGDAGIENAEFSFDIVHQRKRSGVQHALSFDAGYTFAEVSWMPTISYRYTRYSRAFDNLFQGGYRFQNQGEVAVNYSSALGPNTEYSHILFQVRPSEDLTLNAMLFRFRPLSVPEGEPDLNSREASLFADWAVTKNFTLSPLVSFYRPKSYFGPDSNGNQSSNAKTNTLFQLVGWLDF